MYLSIGIEIDELISIAASIRDTRYICTAVMATCVLTEDALFSSLRTQTIIHILRYIKTKVHDRQPVFIIYRLSVNTKTEEYGWVGWEVDRMYV